MNIRTLPAAIPADADPDTYPLIDDELDVLEQLLPLDGAAVIELGCGAARLARTLLQRHPQAQVLGLEVDTRQMAKNRAEPATPGLHFVEAGAQAIPCPDASFDLALMLKSLHHVPLELMDVALAEIARVLRPGGHLYVSEPVYGGRFNRIVKLFNDEGRVRAAAQAALDRALAAPGSPWQAVAEQRFATAVSYADFASFEQRMMRPTFVELGLDEARVATVREAFAPHCGPQGAAFVRPMHLRLLRKRAG